MIRLDDKDVRLLAALQKNGRISKTALAERVNLSPTACWERLKRLEDKGVILAYETRVDPNVFGNVTVVLMTIELDSHHHGDFKAFEDGIREIPEIVDCWAVGGGIDYMLRVVARDIEAYQQLVDDMLGNGLGVRRYFTYVVTKHVKAGPLPIERLNRP